MGYVQNPCNAKERNSSDVPQPRGRWRQPQPQKDGRVPHPANPDEAVKAARVRVQRLESALAALGESGATVPALPQGLIAAGMAEPENAGCTNQEDDDCSSAVSESCWGEMEDMGKDDVVEWGALPLPTRWMESGIEPDSNSSPHWLTKRLSGWNEAVPENSDRLRDLSGQ